MYELHWKDTLDELFDQKYSDTITESLPNSDENLQSSSILPISEIILAVQLKFILYFMSLRAFLDNTESVNLNCA